MHPCTLTVAQKEPLPTSSTALTQSIDLVRRAQEGDRQAVDRLIERYYDRVRPIVRARMGPLLRERVDSVDILQETFLDAVRLLDRFEVRSESSLIRWLAKIAENRIREAVQKMLAAKRDPARQERFDRLTSTAGVGAEPLAKGASPSVQVAGDEAKERFQACLELLPEHYREAILLRDFAGASWDEVAEALGKPSAGAARMLHARALAELASIYRRLGHGPSGGAEA